MTEIVSGPGSSTYQSPVEQVVKDRPRWRRITFVIILLLLVLLLLALFWPVDKEIKKAVKPVTLRKGTGIIGQTKYTVLEAKKVLEIGGEHTVNWVLITVFKVENFAKEARVLDYSHVKLVDDQNIEYAPSPGWTDRLYVLANKKSPWESKIPPANIYNVMVVFGVSEVERKYSFAARDLNWRSTKFIELPLENIQEKSKAP